MGLRALETSLEIPWRLEGPGRGCREHTEAGIMGMDTPMESWEVLGRAVRVPGKAAAGVEERGSERFEAK